MRTYIISYPRRSGKWMSLLDALRIEWRLGRETICVSPYASMFVRKPVSSYKADFLWPHEDDSVEEAGYEFANAKTEAYQRAWWGILRTRIVDEYLERMKGK